MRPVYEAADKTNQQTFKTSYTTAPSFLSSSSSSSYSSGGGAVTVDMSYSEMTEADRQLEFDWMGQQPSVASRSATFQITTSTPINDGRPGSVRTETRLETNGSYDKMESLILQEIREAQERDAAWASSHPTVTVASHDGLNGGNEDDGDYQQLVVMPSVRYSFQRNVEDLDSNVFVPQAQEPVRISRPKIDKPSTPKRVSFIDETPAFNYGDGHATAHTHETLAPHPLTAHDYRPQSKSNPGASLIMRELMEQKKREEELKSHRMDAGFNSVDDRDDEKTQVYVNATEVSFIPESRDSIKYETKQMKLEEPRIIEVSKFTPVQRETTSEALTSAERPTEKMAAAPIVAKSGKVQPIADDDEEETLQPKVHYAPLQESPIEREIRMTREREEALRQVRGLAPLATFDEIDHGATAVEYRVPDRQQSRAFGEERVLNEDATMKKFAESRLQVELKKEKERELALQRQGSIATISEDRIGEPVRFVEIITPEMEEQLQALAREKALQKTKQIKLKETSSAAAAPVASFAAPGVNLMTGADTATSVGIGNETAVRRGGSEATISRERFEMNTPEWMKRSSLTGPQPFTVMGKLPKVLLTYSYAPKQLDDSGHAPVTRDAAEHRIEQEVAEVQRRDDELRRMREAIMIERKLSMEAGTTDVEDGGARSSVTKFPSMSTPVKFGVSAHDSGYQGSPLDSTPQRTDAVVRVSVSTSVNKSPSEMGQDSAAAGAVESEEEMEARLSRRKRLALIAEWENKITYTTLT